MKIHKTDWKDKPIVGMKSYFSSLGMKSREEKLLFLPWDEKWGGKVNYGDYKGSKFAQNGIKELKISSLHKFYQVYDNVLGSL